LQWYLTRERKYLITLIGCMVILDVCLEDWVPLKTTFNLYNLEGLNSRIFERSERNVLRKFRYVKLWRFRRFIRQLFQTFVRRLIRRINVSKVADENNTFCAAASSSDTVGDFLSADTAPSPGESKLYSAPCYHNYSPLSCYQVRWSSPFISCSRVLVFPITAYQMWRCSKEFEKIFTNSC
jgi:hypothetical protein